MKTAITYKKENYIMRISQLVDIESYYQAMSKFDSEVAYLTNSEDGYTKNQIEEYYKKCLIDDSRYDFLILDDEKVIGEAVLNEIDEELKSAHFRICIFDQQHFNKGIGSFAVKNILSFAFEHLMLHRVSLEVFSFNDRAIHLYKKMGFVEEGRLRDSVYSKDGYADIVCMGILENEYRSKH